MIVLYVFALFVYSPTKTIEHSHDLDVRCEGDVAHMAQLGMGGRCVVEPGVGVSVRGQG